MTSRHLATGVLMAVSVVSLGGAQQPRTPAVIDPGVVAAWGRAGASLSTAGLLPTFRFRATPRVSDGLPAPRAPFAVDLSDASLSDGLVRFLGSLTEMREFRCFACQIGNGVDLAPLGQLPLERLDINHLTAPPAALQGLAALKSLRFLQLRDVSAGAGGIDWLGSSRTSRPSTCPTPRSRRLC